MKKLLILFFMQSYLFSQDLITTESDNFIFKTEGVSPHITQINEVSESLNNQLNKALQIDKPSEKREVIVLKSKKSFDDYILKYEIENRDNYIYIRFSDNKSRIIFYDSKEVSEIELRHHLALQYMGHYAKNSPTWFNLGVATYFEELNTFKWIDTLRQSSHSKNIVKTLKNSHQNDLKPYDCWLLIDFLINSDNKEYNRLFWDTLSYIKFSNDKDMSSVIASKFDQNRLDTEIYNYLNSKKSYKDFMDTGLEFYKNRKYNDAIVNFIEASALEPESYSPEYYLGLSYSESGKYNEAYSHFSTSLDNGAPKDIVYYSIGINFFLKKDYAEAKKYLTNLETKDYVDKAKELLNEIAKY